MEEEREMDREKWRPRSKQEEWLCVESKVNKKWNEE